MRTRWLGKDSSVAQQLPRAFKAQLLLALGAVSRSVWDYLCHSPSLCWLLCRCRTSRTSILPAPAGGANGETDHPNSREYSTAPARAPQLCPV